MAVTGSSAFRDVVRITRPAFVARHADVPAGADAGAVWDYAVAAGIDPLLIAATFHVESGRGTAGWAVRTRSWGNTRTPNFGPTPVGIYEQDNGTFHPWSAHYEQFPALIPPRVLCAYATWFDGGASTIERLTVRAGYVYAGRTRIEEIYRHPSGAVWAPAGDGNDPAGYLNKVLAYMNRHRDTEEVGAMPQVADRTYLDWSGGNRPGAKLRGFHACVGHETANEKAGASAEMHRAYVTGPSDGGGASYHLVADKEESIQLLNLDELGYHIGDGADDPDDEAFYTVGGEICVNDRAGFPAACRNMARAFARVLRHYNRPAIDGVTLRMHGSYWSPRNPAVHSACPLHLKAARGSSADWGVSWAQFVAMCREELEALNLGPAPVGEAGNQRLLFDTIARDYPGDEAARYLGGLVREGRLRAKAAGFGQSDDERVAIYQKGALHTLGGYVYGFFDDAAADLDPALAPATLRALRAAGHVDLY